MLQVTLINSDIWNEDLFNFCNNLKEHNKTPEQCKDLIYKYFDVFNIRFHKRYEVQEINNCLLIYKDLTHLLTIKFEL